MTSSRALRLACCFAAAATALAPAPAVAEPMVSSLDTVLAHPNIVIGVYLGGMRLAVTRSLRGSLRGTVTVREGGGTVAVAANTTVVAFLDRQREFRFVAEIPHGTTVDAAPLRLRGFYDFNAHIVSPGLLTLRSLEELLAGRPVELRFVGPIVALDARGAVVQTSIVVEAMVPLRGPMSVRGLPPMAGLAAPTARLGGFDGRVQIVWSSGYPRPFALEGTIDRVDATGALITRFHAVQPEFLFRESDLRAYLADGNAAYPFWTFDVRFADRAHTRWSGTIGEHYNDSPRFRDAAGVERRWSEFSARGQRYVIFADERWDFDPPSPGEGVDTYGDGRVFLQELHRGPVGFRIVSGARAGTRGQIHLGEVELRPPIRVR